MTKTHTKSNSATVKQRRKSCITVPWLTAPGVDKSRNTAPGVDKTWNTEHAGTCQNIPERKKIKNI